MATKKQLKEFGEHTEPLMKKLKAAVDKLDIDMDLDITEIRFRPKGENGAEIGGPQNCRVVPWVDPRTGRVYPRIVCD